MVEHAIHAIRSLCRLIVVLDAGRVIASGSPQQALGNRDVIRSLFW
jgi:ABC-type branched-subunit amino acid transport system ATPase component